jgi:hypothetical protein
MQSGDFSPLFPTELVEKDLGYASHAAVSPEGLIGAGAIDHRAWPRFPGAK